MMMVARGMRRTRGSPSVLLMSLSVIGSLGGLLAGEEVHIFKRTPVCAHWSPCTHIDESNGGHRRQLQSNGCHVCAPTWLEDVPCGQNYGVSTNGGPVPCDAACDSSQEFTPLLSDVGNDCGTRPRHMLLS